LQSEAKVDGARLVEAVVVVVHVTVEVVATVEHHMNINVKIF
jgi:hypothetical protein